MINKFLHCRIHCGIKCLCSLEVLCLGSPAIFIRNLTESGNKSIIKSLKGYTEISKKYINKEK